MRSRTLQNSYKSVRKRKTTHTGQQGKPCPDPSWDPERPITWGGPSITGYHTNHTTEKGQQPHIRKAEERKTESPSLPMRCRPGALVRMAEDDFTHVCQHLQKHSAQPCNRPPGLRRPGTADVCSEHTCPGRVRKASNWKHPPCPAGTEGEARGDSLTPENTA